MNGDRQIHTFLRSEIEAFDFRPEHFEALASSLPAVRFVHHDSAASLQDALADADGVMTWEFAAEWYEEAARLRAVLTPAAGDDWVRPDPSGRVPVIHGTFHGPLLRESLLHAMLFMNHNMKAMIRNFDQREWDRNLQAGSRLLAGQRSLIIGYGSIGRSCGELLRALGMTVTGIARTSRDDVLGIDHLHEALGAADHVAIVLPGDSSTDGLIGEAELARCKPGAFVYNFGRGNALPSDALLGALDHLGGAFLDVVDEEPLPADSPLWTHPNVMITPHSSCVYRDYVPRYLAEAAAHIRSMTGGE